MLDEPTTGMDPYNRKFVWGMISERAKEMRTTLLTTHSMEEADALGDRIGAHQYSAAPSMLYTVGKPSPASQERSWNV